MSTQPEPGRDQSTPNEADTREGDATEAEPTPTGDQAPHEGDLTALPEWAQRELTSARQDAGKYRTRAREGSDQIEGLTARLTALEVENRQAKVDLIKARHKISDEDAATFFPEGAPLEQVEKIAAALGKRQVGAVVPREGTGAQARPAPNEKASFAKTLFTAGE